MPIASSQVIKTVVGAVLGATPALLLWFSFDIGFGVAWCLFMGLAGAFIGAALTLPGVSPKRVGGGFVEMTVGYNPVEKPAENHPQNERVPFTGNPERPWTPKPQNTNDQNLKDG